MNQEEMRFWAAALILGGLCANFHHNLIPSSYWAAGAVDLADQLIKILSETPSCTNHYQRENKAQ